MPLYDLPDELLLVVGQELESERDINATALQWAAGKGQTATAQRSIEQGADVQVEISPGQTPLFQAVECGHEEVVKLLLATDRAYSMLKALERSGRTALCQAAAGGHSPVVELLLAVDGVDPDDGGLYGSPLLWAAKCGCAKVVELLLATNKVNLNTPESADVGTPLWRAARYGFDDVVKLLLAADGVDPDYGGDVTDAYGTAGTPLSQAAAWGHDTVVRLLLATGKVDPDSTNCYSQTPMWKAAHGGHTSVVKQLLATGKVDIDSEDEYGYTPLLFAAFRGHDNTVQLLLEKGAQVDATNSRGSTALHLAASCGRSEIAQLLLHHGATTAVKRNYTFTALHDAAHKGYVEVARVLLQEGAATEVRNKWSETPLHEAVHHNHSDVARLLLQHGADSDAEGEFGCTALHHAARIGSDDIVRLLLEHGASIDAQDSEKATPLHQASNYGNLGTMELLLELGADIDAEDINGWAALERASTVGRPELVSELLSRGAQLRSGKRYRALLLMAMYHANWDVIRRLQERRGDIITDDGDDGLAESLQITCLYGHTDLVQHLLSPDVDLRTADEHGWTLLYSSRMSRENVDVQDILPWGDLPSSGERLPFPPTRWSATDKSPLLLLEDNGSTVSYIGSGEGKYTRTGSVRENHPIPLHYDAFYFEVEILSGDDCVFGIGLCHEYTPLNVLPGWEICSWAYHSDDGDFYAQGRSRLKYGPTFGTGDVVGCHFHFDAEVTFYKNGKPYTVGSNQICGKLYPVVGMQNDGASARVNFGHEPFCTAWLPTDSYGMEQLFAEQAAAEE